MKRSSFPDPYREVIDRFNQCGVRYVVVGMAGINYYARDARETFGTLDYDVFLDPTLKNVQKAVEVLKTLGFDLATQAGPLRVSGLGEMVRSQQTLMATTPYGILIELLLRVSGYPYTELAQDAATFTAQGVPIRVGRLKKLLRSKYLAGRPKDRQFLRRYQLLLKKKT